VEEQATAIEIRGLERRFGAVRVLRGVDLDVRRGEAVVLFGPNGAGKTTLLRAVSGLVRPQAGSIRVLGCTLPAGGDLRRRIGVIGHDSFLYGDLNCEENLTFFARLYGVERPDAAALLAEVELAHVADRPVRTFSRGMLQRLSVARAVLHRPDLLVFDEPFTGLDPHGSALLERIISREVSRGTTVVFTTHDLDAGLRVGSRAILLHRGRVAWDAGESLPSTQEMRSLYDEIVGGQQTRSRS
jgi:heme exporter protein A